MTDYMRQIQAVLDYIHEHLKDDISMEELARITCFSKSHLYKVFEIYTGCTVMAYIRQQRLQQAAKEIRNDNITIAEVAYEFGFESHDVFGRAFKRQFGITPSTFRRNMNVHYSSGRIHLSNERVHDSMNQSKMVMIPEKTLIGIERVIRGEQWGEAIVQMWKDYFDQWEKLFGSITNRVDPELEIDYALANDREEEGVLTYFIGIEVSDLSQVPQGTVSRVIPKTKYAKFTAIGELPDSMGRAFDYIFKEWFPATPYQITSDPIVEYYDMRCATHTGIPPEKHEMDIYIPIETALSQSKEIVQIPSFRAAYYRATGKSGKTWKQVKKEAFDVMIRWAQENNLLSNVTAFGAYNNGGAEDRDFFYEVFLNLDKDKADLDKLSAPDPEQDVQIRTYEGGLYVVGNAVHRYLEPAGRSICEWIEGNEEYKLCGSWFEEFYVMDGKVAMDTMIKPHMKVERIAP